MRAHSVTERRAATSDRCIVWRSSRAFSRIDRWLDHFRLEGAAIHPLTSIGEVTARILGFNDSTRLHERDELSRFGKYPSDEAFRSPS